MKNQQTRITPKGTKVIKNQQTHITPEGKKVIKNQQTKITPKATQVMKNQQTKITPKETQVMKKQQNNITSKAIQIIAKEAKQAHFQEVCKQLHLARLANNGKTPNNFIRDLVIATDVNYMNRNSISYYYSKFISSKIMKDVP